MRGVTYHKQRDRWQARVTVDGERRHLGWFRTEEEAEDAVTVHTASAKEADFDTLKHLIETPVTRRWRSWTPTVTQKLSEISRKVFYGSRKALQNLRNKDQSL